MSCLFIIFIITCTRQASFNSALGAWFFFPFIEDLATESVKYKNLVHVGTNVITAVGTTLLYTVLCIKLLCTARVPGQNHMSSYQYKVFIQCFVVCTLTGIASYIYAYMQFFVVPVELIVLASFAWQFCSGIPCLVYIIVNQTIRRRVISFLKEGTMKSATVTTFHNSSKSKDSRSRANSLHSAGSGIIN